MDEKARARGIRMLKALAREIVKELEADGQPVHPGEVADRVLRGYSGSPGETAERAAVRRELEDFVRELRARSTVSRRGDGGEAACARNGEKEEWP